MAIRSESLTARRAMIDGAVFMVPVQPDEMMHTQTCLTV